MEYRDDTYGAGGGRLTKDAHDRAMRMNRGPIVGSRDTFEQPTPRRRPVPAARTIARPR
jgi:hypothetical protein